MENTTLWATQRAVAQATKEGLKCYWIDMQSACDGCAGHPGIEGHRGMFEAAAPVLAAKMGWTD